MDNFIQNLNDSLSIAVSKFIREPHEGQKTLDEIKSSIEFQTHKLFAVYPDLDQYIKFKVVDGGEGQIVIKPENLFTAVYMKYGIVMKNPLAETFKSNEGILRWENDTLFLTRYFPPEFIAG